MTVTSTNDAYEADNGSVETIAQILVQDYLDFWKQLEGNYYQTDDAALRENAAFHVGALKAEFEGSLQNVFDRTILQDVEYRFAQAGLPRVDRLIAAADAEQLQHVTAGIAAGAPEYDADDWGEDSIDG